MKSKSRNLNYAIAEEMFAKLSQALKEYEDEQGLSLTMPDLVRSILGQWLRKREQDRQPKNEAS